MQQVPSLVLTDGSSEVGSVDLFRDPQGSPEQGRGGAFSPECGVGAGSSLYRFGRDPHTMLSQEAQAALAGGSQAGAWRG